MSMNQNQESRKLVCLNHCAYQLKKIKALSPKEKTEILNKMTNRLDPWEMLCHSGEYAAMNRRGYAAIAFINRHTKEVHIASAGTVLNDYHDWRDNFWLWVWGSAPAKIKPMKAFMDRVVQAVGGNEVAADYQFSTSGHSLGAVIADLTGMEIAARGLQLKESVTFENPGSREPIQCALKKNLLSGAISDQQLAELRCHYTVYNTKPNPINRLNPQFTDECYLVIPRSAKALSSRNSIDSMATVCIDYLGFNYVKQTKKDHSLSNFQNLDKPATVLPVEQWKTPLVIRGNQPGLCENLSRQPTLGHDVILQEEILDFISFQIASIEELNTACSEVYQGENEAATDDQLSTSNHSLGAVAANSTPYFAVKCNLTSPHTSKTLSSKGLKEKKTTVDLKCCIESLNKAVDFVATTFDDYWGIKQIKKDHILSNVQNLTQTMTLLFKQWSTSDTSYPRRKSSYCAEACSDNHQPVSTLSCKEEVMFGCTRGC